MELSVDLKDQEWQDSTIIITTSKLRLIKSWLRREFWTLILLLLIGTVLAIIAGIFWSNLNWQGWLTMYLLLLNLFILTKEWLAPDFLFYLTMVILVTTKILTVEDAIAGFSNKSVIIVGTLFIVGSAIQNTDIVNYILKYILGRTDNLRWAQLKIMLPTFFLSFFIGNTAIVAMMIPVIESWSIQNSIPISQLLMPLNFATSLGSMCTLIGTSVNLIVADLAKAQDPSINIGIFEITKVSLPVALIALTYLTIFSSKILPRHNCILTWKDLIYTQITINTNINLQILNSTCGILFLHEINTELSANIYELVLGSRLHLVGWRVSVNDFVSRYNLSSSKPIKPLYTSSDPILGTVGSINIANNYIDGQHEISRDYEVNKQSQNVKTLLVGILVIIMIALPVANLLSLLESTLLITGLLLILRLISWEGACKSINSRLLLLIATSFSLGEALHKTGVLTEISKSLSGVLSQIGEIGIMFTIYIVTSILTAVISNAGTVIIMFPLAMAMNIDGKISVKAIALLLMIASATFTTHIGYQTNMMVYEPGQYSAKDFLKLGLPLTLIMMLLSVPLIHLII